MNVILPRRLTVDEFLHWYQSQDEGRYELERGRIVVMQAENAGHVRTKHRLAVALAAAIRQTDVPFYSMADGIAVRLPGNRAYEPDATIAPLPEPPDHALEVPNPVAVFEVLSPTPSSVRRDLNEKVVGYSLAATIEHYVVIDPAERIVLHYRRQGDVLVPAEAPVEDVLRLDAIGIEIAVDDVLGPLPKQD